MAYAHDNVQHDLRPKRFPINDQKLGIEINGFFKILRFSYNKLIAGQKKA